MISPAALLATLGRQPISNEFGFDRGGPVDRYYIENFLLKHSCYIRGSVLEVGDDLYTRQYGGEKVGCCDILHVDPGNPRATIIADLANAPHIPSGQFDCIILTQTLQLIYDHQAAMQTCYRILKPGGVLLLTVPGLCKVPQDIWGEYSYWMYTRLSVDKLVGEVFGNDSLTVTAHGNVLAASAFLYGLGAPELSNEQLDYYDKHFPVVITCMAKKKV